MTISESIRKRIETIPKGEPFTPAVFADLGNRAAVDQALSRLAKARRIRRIARGLYLRPTTGRFGFVPPTASQVAKALTRATGSPVQVQGAEAANMLGLTSQVPARSIFYTTGGRRTVRMGNAVIELRPAEPRKLALAGRPAGLALVALRYLGKNRVSFEQVQQVESRLPAGEFAELKQAHHLMPSWLSAVFRAYERKRSNG